MRGIRRSVAVLGMVLASVVILPAASWADTGTASATGGDFGSHVVTCEQTTGLDGQHNPGMHQGYAGWDPAQMP